MTSTESIRATLERLWETDATAYDIAQAVMQAADIESADIEIEVESVISRALLARDMIDVAKVAREVAKMLPGELTAGKRLPLCEAICSEIDSRTMLLGYDSAKAIIRKHFAALSAEDLARVIDPFGFAAMENCPDAAEPKRAVSRATKKAQAVLRLLRKE